MFYGYNRGGGGFKFLGSGAFAFATGLISNKYRSTAVKEITLSCISS